MIKLQYAVIDEEMNEDFEDNLPYGLPQYEICLFQTPVLIEVNKEMKRYPAYTGILFCPGLPMHYKAASGNLIYDWLRFECTEPFLTDQFIPFNTPFECPNYYNFKPYWISIAYENIAGFRSNKMALEQLLRIVLYRIHDYTMHRKPTPYESLIENLHTEIHNFPSLNWTLQEMAHRTNLSIRFLQKLYKDQYQVSCINDVVNSRIHFAKQLLKNTDDTIENISDYCGYRNKEHFCRQFKQKTGMTPSTYRHSESI